MSWATFERYAQTHLYPNWLNSWRVRRIRREVPRIGAVTTASPRRLYIDVSVVSKHDAGTGIQRIVRAVAGQLLSSTPGGWEVVTVGATRKRAYHSISWPAAPGAHPGPAIQGRPGDVFLGLDFALDAVKLHKGQLAAFKRSGGQLWFVMYDLLPAQRPQWFSDKLVVRYRRWLGVLAGLADGFYCISEPVERELRQQLEFVYGLREGYRTHVIPMGWDLMTSTPSTGIPDRFDDFLRNLGCRPTALMVGTLEPRKGHADVVDAFDLLWQQGGNCNLVIVGRPGWKTEQLQSRLRSHAEAGRRLFWLADASDETLTKLYAACTGVVVASYGEGFGLPLIEALGHGKPVLARALPVFDVHKALSVQYFAADATPRALAGCIKHWFATSGTAVPGSPLGMSTWTDTGKAIISSLAIGDC